MKHASEFLASVPRSGPICSESVEPFVRCAACRYASPVRSVPEIIDCSMLGRTKNAELSRQCGAFVAK